MKRIFLFGCLLLVISCGIVHQAIAMRYLSPKCKLALGIGCLTLSALKPKNETLSLLLGHAFLGWSDERNGRITELGLRANVVPLIAGGWLIKSAINELYK